MFKVGEIVGAVRLKNFYDQYVLMVLGYDLDQLPRERKISKNGKSSLPPASYKIKIEMPNKNEYAELKRKRFTSSADDLMQESYEEISNLAEEMRTWHDNLPEGLQSSDRGERIEVAADALENITAQDSTDLMSIVVVFHLPSLDISSRGKRAAEAASILQSVVEAIRDYVGKNRPNTNDSEESSVNSEEDDSENEYKDSDYDDLDAIASQCEEDSGEVEGIEFPGMYD